MLCQNCQQKRANVQLRMNMNGQEKQMLLCSACYQKNKQAIGQSFHSQGFGPLPMDEFFKEFSTQKAEQMNVPPKETNNSNNGFLDQLDET